MQRLQFRSSRRLRNRTAARGAVVGAVLVTLLGALLPGVALTPAAAAVTTAVQNLDACKHTALAANDDGSTAQQNLGFSINFFGKSYDKLYVGNNGYVTFDAPSSTYTPYSMASATAPIIAPFFADVDTRGQGSLVTYSFGGAPAANGEPAYFCVDFVNVDYYNALATGHASKLNSFQLLLIDRSGAPGGRPGDFDIVFNYDKVVWETGDASGGSAGLGGLSARVGYSNGNPTYSTEVAGSGTNGALLDGGSTALVSGSLNSSQPGRYIFPVRAPLSLTADQKTVPASPGAVPLSAIPRQPSASSTPSGSGLDSLNILGSGLDSLNILGSPLTSQALAQVTLSDTPLRSGSWETRIFPSTRFDGVPATNVTWQQLLTDPKPPALATLSYSDVDWTKSPLGKLNPIAIFLGNVRARDVALAPTSTLTASQRWCPKFEAQGFSNCGQGFGGLDATFLAMQLAGVDFTTVPLGSTPFKDVNPAKANFLNLALLGGVNQRGVQSMVGLANTPFGALRYNELTAASKDKVFNCSNVVYCGTNPTVAEAAVQTPPAIKSTARIVDLGTLSSDSSTWSAPASLGAVSTGQVLFSLLPTADNPIEDINLDDLVHYKGDAGHPASIVNFHYRYSNTGAALMSPPVASATVSRSFVYEVGSAKVNNVAAEPAVQTTDAGTVLSWTLVEGIPAGGSVAIDFDMRPGRSLGTFGSSAKLVNGSSVAQTSGAEITVGERFESNGTPESATPLEPDVVYFSHIGQAQDLDYFTFPVTAATPPGTRIRFSLSHLSLDGDLVVYAPASAGGTQSLAGTGLDSLNILGSGLDSLNILGSPVPGQTPGINDKGATVLPEVQQDIPLLSTRVVAGISSHRSLDKEFVEVTVPQGVTSGDTYLIQGSGFLDATSTEPYVLRAKVNAVVAQPPCPTRTMPHDVLGSNPSVDPATKTVFLLSQQRLAAKYDATRAAAAASALTPTFLGRDDIKGQVINLDAIPNVQTAFANWDSFPCVEQRANDVVSAITASVRGLMSSGSALGNVVIVGTDTIVPHGRVLDLTDIVNERTYPGNLAFTTAGNANNSLFSSVADGYILTDNPYGDFNPVPFGGQYLYVPDVAVGRLGETPEDIAGQIGRFTQYGGILDPSTAAFTASYDFMKDMGGQVLGILGGSSRNDDTWTASDIKSSVFNNTTAPPKTVAINGHANHFRLLGGVGNATNDLSDTVSTRDVSGGQNLARATIFGMGCHYGLSVEDFLVGLPGPDALDWQQAYAQKQVASFTANTGYGYGDRNVIAYSERLMVLFAQNLKAKMPTGQALQSAKQTYFGELGSYSEYDRKVIEELTGWGLPQWHLAGSPPTPDTSTVTPSQDTSTGLQAYTFPAISPSFNQVTTPEGSYFQDGTTPPQITVYRPPTARTERNVTPPSGASHLAPRGFFVTGADVTTLSNFDPVLSIPDFDQSATQREPRYDDVNFPSGFGTIGSTYVGPAGGTRYKLNLLSNGFQASGYNGTKVIGTARKLSNIGVQVFYALANEADRTPPTFTRVDGSVTGTTTVTANFDISLTDETSSNSTDIKAVQVLVVDGSKLRSVRLSPAGNDRWTGSTTLTTSKSLRFSACAVDDHANTGCTKQKGNDFGDNTAPTITISAPVNGATFALNAQVASSYSCLDNGVPAPTCNGPVASGLPIDTATPGRHVFSVTASDEANNTIVKEAVYYVNFASFVGFSTPVTGTDSSTAPINSASSGQAIPLKWQVKGLNGQSYPGLTDADIMIQWKGISCDGSRSETALVNDPTLALLDFKLKYDPVTGQYLIVVKTPKDVWSGTCKRLNLTMAGVETHFADFKFS
ncbi:MAG TPA: nidogen-like domain-containing protein [Acidimicrobiales bacterium]|nr:nidogen-like domain-containing protein [Acidimicrobiales bacterium]